MAKAFARGRPIRALSAECAGAGLSGAAGPSPPCHPVAVGAVASFCDVRMAQRTHIGPKGTVRESCRGCRGRGRPSGEANAAGRCRSCMNANARCGG